MDLLLIMLLAWAILARLKAIQDELEKQNRWREEEEEPPPPDDWE